MSIPNDETPAAAFAATSSSPTPRSPKRPPTDPEDLSGPATKRSRAASLSDDEANTRATTAAMANASLAGKEQEETRGTVMDTGAEGNGASTTTAATTVGEESTAAATASQPSRETNHDEAQETTTTTTTTTPKSKMCGVCTEKEGKYKCTRCALPFCSVPCSKIHRENHPPDPEPSAAAKIPSAGDPAHEPLQSDAPKPPRDPRSPFSVLDNSDQLRYLFRRYPGLQARLLDILAATEPPPEMQSTGSSLNDMMKARAMAAANPKKEQWTHDVGIRNGKAALRKARDAAGEDGEGVREYIELINHLMSEANATAEAEEVVRKQAAEKDAELIRRLMAEDRG
ncbi:HIT zinc finger [Colletotrichum graminicola]|uniref:HIT zinc finger n=1 Tax=Colletotrichum graminicola (strain M1.001 / M2 / FGSC 10212) TaxID=645133 RepID=E3QMW3_COLGM|nr:HIT zinc finger [Colletotrichum graminicola M1.001]EFQ32201.1 HIT zinc finger [Colletotrichum graminicola M1.001]WDK09431.1 HIT zinc finger [Colletotrichum graminicola]